MYPWAEDGPLAKTWQAAGPSGRIDRALGQARKVLSDSSVAGHFVAVRIAAQPEIARAFTERSKLTHNLVRECISEGQVIDLGWRTFSIPAIIASLS